MSEFESRSGWRGQGQRSIEERRRILRSLGVGSAVVGAPSLAAAGGGADNYCKMGGTKYRAHASAVGSVLASVATSKPAMYGNRCSDYRNSSFWGTGWTNGKGRSLSYALCADVGNANGMRFWVAFDLSQPSWGSPKFRKCSEILRDYPTSDEAIWLTALFNANKLYSTERFPYTPAGVLALYRNQNPLMGNWTDASLSGKARTLFRDYLSQGPT